jgi:hypothetical protein
MCLALPHCGSHLVQSLVTPDDVAAGYGFPTSIQLSPDGTSLLAATTTVTIKVRHAKGIL